MNQPIYQVDAFTDRVFSGNPAAVCPLSEWLSDALMQQIAMENNLAETAFYVKQGEEYHIRWFTPTIEVDLCGHATLAAAFVLFHLENQPGDSISFHSPRSGPLSVHRSGEWLTLNFPTDRFEEIPLDDALSACFDQKLLSAFRGKTDYLLLTENEEAVKNAAPALDRISQLNARGVILSAAGDETDFVSRFFAPQSGIDEDPVTGSAHTTLTPYWAKRLGKQELSARQLSPRGGFLRCTHLAGRVEISGQARLYLKGEIYLPG